MTIFLYSESMKFRTYCDDDNFPFALARFHWHFPLLHSLPTKPHMWMMPIHTRIVNTTQPKKMLLNNLFGHDMHVCTQYLPESLNKRRRQMIAPDRLWTEVSSVHVSHSLRMGWRRTIWKLSITSFLRLLTKVSLCSSCVCDRKYTRYAMTLARYLNFVFF